MSLDERLDFPAHPELRGLRYARNSVHHKWSEALWLDRAGITLPAPLPMKFMEWRWRRDLPPPDKLGGQAEYVAHLADRAARHTLDAVLAFLDDL